MTCTASQGLALMHEILYIAAGNRLPIVMAMVNRTLCAPINIHGDHSDAMGSRDCGWIQLFCQDAQEVYDTTIQAVRIAEHPDVCLPVMVCFDGFTSPTTWSGSRCWTRPRSRSSSASTSPRSTCSTRRTRSPSAPWSLPPFFFEHKVNMIKALEGSVKVIEEVGKEFEALSGRPQPLVETYGMEDAEVAIVALSGIAGTARWTAMQLREQGHQGRRGAPPGVPPVPDASRSSRP